MIVSTVEPSPIFLPRLAAAPRCFEQNAQGLFCTRLREHHGRHAATGHRERRVLDVWPEPPAEPCS